MNKRKIGILGGTFDPVHRMHLELAKQAKEQFFLEEVWLMPSGDPPHKSGRQITNGSDRLQMLQLAIEHQPGLVISDYELQRSGKIYTAETLRGLSLEYPDIDWYFIMGGDSLLYLEDWYHPEEILTYAIILAAVRGESGREKEEIGNILKEKRKQLLERYPKAEIHLMKTEPNALSSSQIRQILEKEKRTRQEEECLSDALPEPVRVYIQENGLYLLDKA